MEPVPLTLPVEARRGAAAIRGNTALRKASWKRPVSNPQAVWQRQVTALWTILLLRSNSWEV